MVPVSDTVMEYTVPSGEESKIRDVASSFVMAGDKDVRNTATNCAMYV